MQSETIKSSIRALNRVTTLFALGILGFTVRYGPNSTILYDPQIFNVNLEQCKSYLNMERVLHDSSNGFWKIVLLFILFVILLCQANLYLLGKLENSKSK